MPYTLKPDAFRGAAPSLLVNLTGLGIIYFGLRFNIRLLGFWDSASLLVLFIISAMGIFIILNGLKVMKISYIFSSYTQIIVEGENKTLLIQSPVIKQSFLDKMFNTCSIELGGGKMEYVPFDPRIITYIQQLASYRNI